MKQILIRSMIAGAFGLVLSTASAAGFPERAITVVVPYPPGGGTDITGRLIADELARQEGWTTVVDNKAGAAGSVGLGHLSRQKADGYTIGIGQTSNLTINPNLNKDLQYDPLKDFTTISLINEQPMVVVVAPDSKFKDFKMLLEEAKKPDVLLNMGTPGVGTASHLSMEYLAQLSGANFSHVPYRGAAAALTEILGGHIDFAVASLPSFLSHIKSGAVRPLVVTTAQRAPSMPDVPTVSESGYDGFSTSDWKAVVAPAGLPAEQLEILNAAIAKALQNPSLVEAFEKEGSQVVGGGPEKFNKLLNEESKRWGDVIEKANIGR
ncbi:Bug family tripartite tricarboxylate transporter substrate binding protein [Orrella sp. 11846]|uniref:Bug family tripartite tricarboxylate transporter substrate binding protein n=1 Tax=Orrella sp. 11846 TaxID=3409913 RepID=UPI003B59BF1D